MILTGVMYNGDINWRFFASWGSLGYTAGVLTETWKITNFVVGLPTPIWQGLTVFIYWRIGSRIVATHRLHMITCGRPDPTIPKRSYQNLQTSSNHFQNNQNLIGVHSGQGMSGSQAAAAVERPPLTTYLE